MKRRRKKTTRRAKKRPSGQKVGAVSCKANERMQIAITVNGDLRHATVRPKTTLLDLLRDELGLKGSNKGCGTGDCGACTVIIDGKAVNSCLVLALDAAGKEITTIEGLAPPGDLHPIQKAFIDLGAIQCGFCSPGMIMTAKAFLDRNPEPTEEDCKKAISGNLCRCTGYKKIIEAMQTAAEVMRDE